MEIGKLQYRNSVWLSFDKNVELIIKCLKSGKVTVRYTRGILERFELSLIGEEAKKLKATLASLSFEKWENSYCCDCVLDGEAWDLEITFVDGTKKSVDGSNAYPKCWKKIS